MPFKGGGGGEAKNRKISLTTKTVTCKLIYIVVGTISDHFIWHWHMTYSGIVQQYREGIGAFNWPEGVGTNCKTSQNLFLFYSSKNYQCFHASSYRTLITILNEAKLQFCLVGGGYTTLITASFRYVGSGATIYTQIICYIVLLKLLKVLKIQINSTLLVYFNHFSRCNEDPDCRNPRGFRIANVMQICKRRKQKKFMFTCKIKKIDCGSSNFSVKWSFPVNIFRRKFWWKLWPENVEHLGLVSSWSNSKFLHHYSFQTQKFVEQYEYNAK